MFYIYFFGFYLVFGNDDDEYVFNWGMITENKYINTDSLMSHRKYVTLTPKNVNPVV